MFAVLPLTVVDEETEAMDSEPAALQALSAFGSISHSEHFPAPSTAVQVMTEEDDPAGTGP